jgi:hypothetical protein
MLDHAVSYCDTDLITHEVDTVVVRVESQFDIGMLIVERREVGLGR